MALSSEALEPRLAHIAAGAYPGFCSIKRLEVFLLPPDGMPVHRRSLPRNFVRFPQQIAGTHLYTWVERGTVRVKRLAQEQNTLSPARARTRTARSGVERTKHRPPRFPLMLWLTQMMCCNVYIPLLVRQMNDVEENLNPTIFDVISCELDHV